jgi:hypothetical protein
MVITLRNGNRLEMRAVPNFRATYDYINERVIARNPLYTGATKK